MNKAIYKQVVTDVGPVLRFHWPAGAEILHADVKDAHPCIWYVCDPTQPPRMRTFGDPEVKYG